MSILILILAISATDDSTLHIKVPNAWPNPCYNFIEHPLTKPAIDMGRALFYDPILSKDSSISCASCHNSYTAFAHVDHNVSHGIHDRIGFRNAPALINLAWRSSFMWDAAIRNLDRQALVPIQDSNEMDESIANILLKLNQSARYRKLSFRAWGDSNISTQNLLQSMSQFLITLVSANSKYDSMMQGRIQFNVQEKNGYTIFQQHCSSCHVEPLFTNSALKSNGLKVDTVLNDFGRMRITKASKDSLLFMVPTLRNIEFTFPYMHDGRFKKLSEVIQHYTHLDLDAQQLSSELKRPISLTPNEKVDLIAFLLTLSDREFNFNADYNYPRHLLK
ncbi:MAG: c-type cytochrome [Bacteroidetes bacterium]|nr:c-type cytochrome [Bacteroidota bacterium]